MADTTTVAVPPEGTLAAMTPRGLAVFNTDGSGFRVLWPASFAGGRSTSWSPNGAEIAFEPSCCSDRFQVASLAGGVRFLTPSGSGTLYPRFSRDGQWIYYTRLSRLQRIHPDGTGEEAVPIVNGAIDAAPAFSPDGSRAVIVRLFANQLLMLDLATGATTDLALVGQSPAWSAASNLIAFLSSPDGNTIRVVNPDGTGLRTVASLGYGLNIGWSPDGQWSVAHRTSNSRPELNNASLGAMIPLSFTAGYAAPSWKP